MTGFIILIIAGICQGSFGLGYKKYPPFAWSVFWGIYSLLCAFSATLSALIFARRIDIIFDAFSLMPILCGALWGISSICFSKAINKIGMSMVYGISMGISTITGTVLPMLMYSTYPQGIKAILLVAGLILCVSGIAVVTLAGIRRDGGLKKSATATVMAIASGLGSGAMNVGFSASEMLGADLMQSDFSDAAISAIRWLPVLVGGCMMCVVWCIGEGSVKKELNTIIKPGALVRTVKLFGVSIVWYAALLLYGLANTQLSDKVGEAAWALFNALALLISVGWGLKTGEWKNTSKKILFAGCILLIISWLFIAL